jgi:hypothetical protein
MEALLYFQGFSEVGGRSENLLASTFNQDLSNETTLARSISLDSTFNT